MRKPTMSIRTLLAVMAFIALACVALVRGNYIWASSMFTAALAVISFAVLAAIFRRGAKQAFWIGFALFGWGYLWMAHWSSDPSGVAFGPNGPQWQLQESNGTLATTQLLNYFYMEWLPTIRPYPAPVPAPPGGGGGFGGGGLGGGGFGGAFGPSAGGGAFGPGTGVMVGTGVSGTLMVTPAPATVAVDYPALHEFMRVGHSLFVIMLAFVGGLIANQLYKSREEQQPAKREPLTSV